MLPFKLTENKVDRLLGKPLIGSETYFTLQRVQSDSVLLQETKFSARNVLSHKAFSHPPHTGTNCQK